jgi:sugar phosphate isomerase/epimerase
LKFGIEFPRFEDTATRILADGVLDFSRFDVVDMMREKVGLGYEVIEISMDLGGILPGSLTPESIKQLVDLKDELNHSYTVHLPLWSVEPATFNEEVRKGSVNSIVNAIELAEPLNPEAFVRGIQPPELSAEDRRHDMHVHDVLCGIQSRRDNLKIRD